MCLGLTVGRDHDNKKKVMKETSCVLQMNGMVKNKGKENEEEDYDRVCTGQPQRRAVAGKHALFVYYEKHCMYLGLTVGNYTDIEKKVMTECTGRLQSKTILGEDTLSVSQETSNMPWISSMKTRIMITNKGAFWSRIWSFIDVLCSDC